MMGDQALTEQNREIEVVDTCNAVSTADIAKGGAGKERRNRCSRMTRRRTSASAGSKSRGRSIGGRNGPASGRSIRGTEIALGTRVGQGR